LRWATCRNFPRRRRQQRRRNFLAQRQIDAMRIRSSGPAQRVSELSGGNQQKVVIGRWLERDCSVLLFDEPTRGIDVGAKFDIYALLGELTRQGKALVVVSSDLRELMLICDRIGVLSAGRLIDTFERDSWTQDDLLAAAFAGYQKRDALLNEAAPRISMKTASSAGKRSGNFYGLGTYLGLAGALLAMVACSRS
jgi:ribose transport system ATP-binding protein